MSQVITTPTPKVRFQSVKENVQRHRDLIASEPFEKATDFALLQFQAELSREDLNFNSMAAVGLRIQGAQEYLRILRNLAESQTITSVRVDDNLEHNLK